MKPSNIGSIAAKLIAAIMLFAALGRHAFDYYTMLRWIACGVAAFTAFQALQAKKSGWTIIFVVVAIVLNQIAEVHLRRDTWVLVDNIAGVLLLVSVLVLDFRKPGPRQFPPPGNPEN